MIVLCVRMCAHREQKSAGTTLEKKRKSTESPRGGVESSRSDSPFSTSVFLAVLLLYWHDLSQNRGLLLKTCRSYKIIKVLGLMQSIICN